MTNSKSGSATQILHDYGIVYAEPADGGEPLTLDVHRLAGGTRGPVVVWLHGGGWAAGASTDSEEIRLHPLAARGIVVVSVNYRLAARGSHPVQADDVHAALAWVRTHAEQIGADGDTVFLAGASAGGHLAALVGLTAALQDSIRGIISYYPVVDPLRWDAETAARPQPGPDTFSGRLAVARGSWPPPPRGRDLLRDTPSGSVSPVLTELSVSPQTPPVLILHGSDDSCVDAGHAVSLYDHLVAGGVDSSLLLLAPADHGSERFHSGPALGLVLGFIAQHAQLN